ncbi:MAG: hypothetical protein NZ703_11455 [Gemmataceae bacterium]|nr:hypothetical protein [Gemmataceae bacterium]
MNLVLIETSGNQAYIFETNKLRENVGASELVYRTGTRFVTDAVAAVGGQLPSRSQQETTSSPNKIHYPPISDKNPVEIILQASGKAVLLVRDVSTGHKIVREVTLRALKEAPGLEVRGVVGPDFDFQQHDIHEQIKGLHHEYEAVRSRLSGPAARFQRLPIVAECVSSGLPASTTLGGQPISATAFCKVLAAEDGLKRIQDLMAGKGCDAVHELEQKLGCDWLAVVHADGNGLGEVFRHFNEKVKICDNRDNRDNRDYNRKYIKKLRDFSLALDQCAQQAFREALTVLKPRMNRLPIVPLVLGGDDLTVVCDGQQALQFTKKFLDAFERQTREHQAIQPILANGVTSCAGVAIIKPHFPFFSAYQLAEQLLQSAKKIAKQSKPDYVSAIDYHILYDASGAELGRIRRELTVDGGRTLLVGRPYVTTEGKGVAPRRWSDLVARIAAVRARDADGRRRLPNSMLHELRQGLFLGQQAADARLQLVWPRYRNEGLDQLLGSTSASGVASLFWTESVSLCRTALLDAIDTAEFWEAQS